MAYGVTLTAPTITGTHTDMPVLITEDDLPSDAYNSANQIDNGGGNLVAYTDSTKTTQLPIEVVSFVTGASPSIEVWVKRTMATGNTIYLEADDVQTAQPAVTSTYGRNAVWSDYEAVWHMGSTTDSSGNSHTLSLTGSPSTASTSVGDGYDFTSSSGVYAEASDAAAFDLDGKNFTLQLMLKHQVASGGGQFQALIDKAPSSNNSAYRLLITDSDVVRFRNPTWTSPNLDSSAQTWSVGDEWWISASWDGTNRTVYKDGTSLASDTPSTSTSDNTEPYGIGIDRAGSDDGDFIAGEARVRHSALSSNWLTTEQDNQSTATWFTNSGWADSGGGSTDNLLADDVSSNSELTSPSVGQTHGLLSVSVESLSELSSPAITQTHALLSVSVESLSELTLPALSTPDVLTADDVESTTELTAPQIAQVHNILGDDVQSLTELTTPALGQVHSLTSVSVESASELTAPVLFEPSEDTLLAEDIESLTELSTPTLREGLAGIVQGDGGWFIFANGRYYTNKT